MSIYLRNDAGFVKEVPTGFSWTTFFFGCFVPIIRGSIGVFFAMLILALCTFGISNLIFPFFINKLYIGDLLEKGFRPADKISKEYLIMKSFIVVNKQSDSQL